MPRVKCSRPSCKQYLTAKQIIDRESRGLVAGVDPMYCDEKCRVAEKNRRAKDNRKAKKGEQ